MCTCKNLEVILKIWKKFQKMSGNPLYTLSFENRAKFIKKKV